uniref:CC domain-containing protein n=1 Tax=Syphacia muris TaxID=451379 RepID=A0A158R5W5_9BILA
MIYSIIVKYIFIQIIIIITSTPVIGGLCDLGAAEVQIGGKQTQFFLKCEANQDGKGVWVVKSRNAASPTAIPQPSTTLPPANTEPQQHPKQVRKQPAAAYCELNAREADSCTAAVTCLQRNNEDATSFLQCDQSNNRWIKKSCSDGNIFSFEHQACITNPKAQNRYSTGSQGVVCTFTQCSNSNPCNQGTCNNGYCCTSGSYQPSAVASCCLRQQCPGGAYGSCMNGYCSPGYQCMQSTGMCCPVAQQSFCPMGGSPMGSCISGTCSQGYRCVRSSNLCCPSSSTNPFVCPDGTQAVGACINGQCGSGFACVNGLCCNNTSQSPRCLDGSQAVGACINGRCGSGYICTTGNICCLIIKNLNNLCKGRKCCCINCCIILVCPSGEESIGPCINDLCPSGYSCVNDQCCPGASFTCAADAFIAGPCINDACMVGFSCDTTLNRCCPTGTLLGQCVNGKIFTIPTTNVTNNSDACPTGYTCYPTAAEAANTGATQMCYAVCDGDTTAFVGNAVNDVCPINTVKKLNACCQQFRRHRSPERKSALIASYSEPLPGKFIHRKRR